MADWIDLGPVHNSDHEYDDNCPGCQPCLANPTTGEMLPDDHPAIVAIRKAWREQTTLAERHAWHRVVMQGSKSPQDLAIANAVNEKMQKALGET